MKKFLPILKKCPLFIDIDENNIERLLSSIKAKKIDFDKGGLVFMAGDKASSFGIVLSGRVNIVQESYWGNRSILTQIEEGELFGEAFSCAGVDKMPLSAICAKESEILLIDYQKIVTQNANLPHIKLLENITRILARKNIALTQKIEHICAHTIRQRLLSFLSTQAKQTNSGSFEINFNRQELAEYLSVDRSAMCAELSKMRDENILRYKKGYFELLL